NLSSVIILDFYRFSFEAKSGRRDRNDTHQYNCGNPGYQIVDHDDLVLYRSTANWSFGNACRRLHANQFRVDSQKGGSSARVVDTGLCNRAVRIAASQHDTLKAALEIHRN